jgi:magnesium-transporting ATPase (P-type)
MYSNTHQKHYDLTVAQNNQTPSMINPNLVLKEYDIVEVLDFDSTRKRMSIIVRDMETNQFIMFCKGADSAIFTRCVCQTSEMYDECLKEFSENGWRTIVFAYKLLTKEQCEIYSRMLSDANNDILNREFMLDKAYDEIENEMHLLGLTAVEDKLQDNVEQTLCSLRDAGIKIWVLTGDKIETAINVSESCKHFTRDMTKFVMKSLKNVEEIRLKFDNIREM